MEKPLSELLRRLRPLSNQHLFARRIRKSLKSKLSSDSRLTNSIVVRKLPALRYLNMLSANRFLWKRNVERRNSSGYIKGYGPILSMMGEKLFKFHHVSSPTIALLGLVTNSEWLSWFIPTIVVRCP